MSFLHHIFMPSFISLAARTTLYSSRFSAHFSTRTQKNIPPLLNTPFADLAATFNLSSADIARILKKTPSLQNPKTLQNVERVLHLLTEYGCTQHHIARIMRSQPQVLTINAEKLLRPKIELLKDLGFDEKHLPKLLSKAPAFLSVSLQDSLLPKITFLKSLFQSHNLFLKAVKRSPVILGRLSLEKSLRPSLAFWEGCGLQREELARFLSTNTRLMGVTTLTTPKVDLIRKIGISKESKMYKHVLSAVASVRIETLESKMDCFREWGLSAEEIWELFRTSPAVFILSKNTVREKMEFVVRTIELPPNSVVTHSAFLKCSLEKVIKPRFAVFQRMKSLAGVEHLKRKQVYSLVAMAEVNFVNKILKGHPELETLYALHRKAIPNV